MEYLGYYLTALGILLTIIGLHLAYHSIKARVPLYVFTSSSMGGVDHPVLTMQFAGRQIPNIHAVRMVMWNAGRLEIRSEDLPAGKAGPTIRFKEAVEILSVRCFCSNACEASTLCDDNNTIGVTFDFLNPGDSILCEILCTNESGNDPAVELTGAIKGAEIDEGYSSPASLLDIMSAVLWVAVMSYYSYRAGSAAAGRFFDESLGWAFFLGLVSLVLIVLIYFLGQFVSGQVTKGIPKKYSAFSESGRYDAE